MELKEARTVADVIRRTTGGGTYTSEVSKAIVALDDRITELETWWARASDKEKLEEENHADLMNELEI